MSLSGRWLCLGVVAGLVVACGGASQQDLGSSGGGGGDGGVGTDGATLGDGSSSKDGGGGNDGGSKKDGNGDTDAPPGGECGKWSAFTAPSAECTTSGSCVYGLHEVSCCGNPLALAFNHSFYSQFQAAEAAWDATCPVCTCPSTNQVTAQDGKSGPLGNLQVECVIPGGAVVGTCTSFFR
jgi:hypothetical protein